ncbi:MAG: DUF5606 domain-containing protein [Bacteroides sp.]|jgi:hypothetical protein|nr:DUF5606 domain-containing protein [Bacteroides sp.]
MDLSDILTISGKSGLYKVISQTKNGLVAESLTDGKKIPVFLSDRSSALEDISIFTQTEDIPLKEILLKIYEKEDGKSCIEAKEDPAKLKAYFESILPDYDQDRVYISDIKKVFTWYNLLLEKDMIKPEEPEQEEKPEEKPAKEEKPEKQKKPAAKKPAKKE